MPKESAGQRILLICDKFLSVFDYGNKDTSLTKDFKDMYTIDNQPWPKYSEHLKLDMFFFSMGYV